MIYNAILILASGYFIDVWLHKKNYIFIKGQTFKKGQRSYFVIGMAVTIVIAVKVIILSKTVHRSVLNANVPFDYSET